MEESQKISKFGLSLYKLLIKDMKQEPRPFLSYILCQEIGMITIKNTFPDSYAIVDSVEDLSKNPIQEVVEKCHKNEKYLKLSNEKFDSIGVYVSPTTRGGKYNFGILFRNLVSFLPIPLPTDDFSIYFIDHFNSFRTANKKGSLELQDSILQPVNDLFDNLKIIDEQFLQTVKSKFHENSEQYMFLSFDRDSTFCEIMAGCFMNNEFVEFISWDIATLIAVKFLRLRQYGQVLFIVLKKSILTYTDNKDSDDQFGSDDIDW
ncbi:hypothetical protein GPJ56_006201 [Histomonas meleagridis]|uniref:uncharacterized protein n=1 Tax=Histomonas meleagridis TaxID=135588 RepID=UPI00355A0A4D|nr:hypothetical protein GPJ56_006201 [Histomonas meleagridis]KAH0796984.1 hypothetical protein GO595_010877 [Histomonas meleagridis]